MSDLRFFEELGTELERAARRPRAHRRHRVWAAIAASGATLTAGIVTAILLLSASTPAAYAGWSRVPSTPSPSLLETAVHKCYKVGTDNSQLALPASGGTTQPVLAESRDGSAAAVYVVGGQVYMCLYENGSMYETVASASMGPLRTAPGPGLLSIPYEVDGGSGSSTPKHPLTSAQWQKLKSEPASARLRARQPLINGGGYFALGQAASNVSAVSFSFANGETVTASIQNGWYFAWWPWRSDPTSATVTTSTGTTTSPMKDTWPGGHGSRPYPACQPGSSGCIFDAKQPAALATTTTPTETTTTPTTNTPVATATRECDAYTLTYSVMTANAFAGPPILTQVRGDSTALLKVTDGRVDVCLVGGNRNNFHAFFAWLIENYGPVRVAPGPDQISVPYGAGNGVGGGRPHSARRETSAEALALRERMHGGGYGPYALGQAGNDVSAVTFAFANGKTVAATVANGWYFAWWPWISTPTSVAVTTTSGTTTSPLASSKGFNATVVPGCQPGSSGCVFDKTPPATTTTSTQTATTPTTTPGTATTTASDAQP